MSGSTLDARPRGREAASTRLCPACSPRRRRELGASSVEWAGILAASVSFVAVLLLSTGTIGQQLVCTVESAILGTSTACPAIPPVTVGQQSVGGQNQSVSQGGPGQPLPQKPPVDQVKVGQAVNTVHKALTGFVTTRSDLEEIEQTLKGLNGPELDAAIAALSDDDLREWIAQMEQSGWLFHLGGWDQKRRQQMWSELLKDASPETVRRLAGLTKDIQPSFDDVGKNEQEKRDLKAQNPGYEKAPEGARPVVDGVSPEDVTQGQIRDCWYIASLQAVARTDPSIIENAIRDNGNGTYTVTLYHEGKPVEVTVTADQVKAHDSQSRPADDPVFARARNPKELWPSLMEKALAAYEGTYGKIESNSPVRGMEVITGKKSQTTSNFTAKDLKNALENKQAVTLSSKAKPSKYWFFGTYNEDEYPDPLYRPGVRRSDGGPMSEQLYYGHAYSVKSVDLGDPNDPSDDKVTVVNPWGTKTSEITMTYEDFKAGFAEFHFTPLG